MLSDLVGRLPLLSRRGPQDTRLLSATADSREVGPGTLFAAIEGSATDGHRFIPQALERGAVAILLRRWPESWPEDVVGLQVDDPRRSLAVAASALAGDPAEAMSVIAVTGTNGKTTTVSIVRSILDAAGLRGGTLGTTGIAWNGAEGEVSHAATHTTPEGPALYAWLQQMREDGVQAVALELSSHALHQGRAAGLSVNVAAWSNLGRDHLDYHGDLERYEQAKALLLTEWLPNWGASGCTAVLNVDDPVVAGHQGRWPRLLRVSCQPGAVERGEADLAPAADPSFGLDGVRADLSWNTRRLHLRTSLLGRHNLANCLLAGGCALASGIEAAAVERGWAETRGAAGRLERVERADGRGPLVLVDYAHSPDALAEALSALRSLRPARVITVFGCGGDRDHGKRPLMAAAAASGSDLVFLTSDNPRGEAPEAILDAAEPGLAASNASYRRMADRGEAIAAAVAEGSAGDVVLVAGKGHETWQEVDGQKLPFDDCEHARQALEIWT